MASILMLISKQFEGDTRVNRESLTLSDAGYLIKVIAWERAKGEKRSYRHSESIDVNLIGPRCSERNFLSFIFNLPRFWLSVFLEAMRSDCVIVHANDFDTLPIGFIISRMKRCPLVYDAHESYADMVAKDVPHFITGLIRRVEKIFVRRASLVITANEIISKMIGAENAIPILSCPSRAELPIDNPSTPSCKTHDALMLAYFGTLEPGRFVLEAIDAISKNPGWCMVVGGSGTLSDQVKKLSDAHENISYLGKVSHEEAMRQTAASDAAHIILDPSNYNYRISSPLRLFESMSVGIPSIVTANTHGAEIVLKEDCGYVIDPTEEALVQMLNQLADKHAEMIRKGENGKSAFQREYNWERQSAKLLFAYQKLRV